MTDSSAATLAQDVAARLEPNLSKVILAVADAVTQCAALLRELGGPTASSSAQRSDAAAGDDRTQNAFGDVQCAADLATDAAFWACLRSTGVVSFGCSEEQPELVPLCDATHAGPVYAVAWDPLDGSSVVDAAFSVGSIVGIWPKTMLGATGGDQAAALYAVYGPRTVLVVASRGHTDGAVEVHEYVLCQGTQWVRMSSTLRVKPTSVYYAPANVRCSIDNEAYNHLLQSWMGPQGGGGQRSMTLRYSGALVADVHHILTKGGGCFVCPGSGSAPSKLRLVFEALPIAFIVHAAGGDSLGADGTSLLGTRITSCEQKTMLCVGSAQLVAQCRPAMTTRDHLVSDGDYDEPADHQHVLEVSNTLAEDARALQALVVAETAAAAVPHRPTHQAIGNALFPLVSALRPGIEGKVTGMLLDLDDAELALLLSDESALVRRVEEAATVICSHVLSTLIPRPDGSPPPCAWMLALPKERLLPLLVLLARLSAMDDKGRRQALGERLFPRVAAMQRSSPAKITGMLLELPFEELLVMCEDSNSHALQTRVEQCVELLISHALAAASAETAEVNALRQRCAELSASLEKSEADRVCCICLDRPRSRALLPCTHLVLCDDASCAAYLGQPAQCPVCRATVTSYQRVFL